MRTTQEILANLRHTTEWSQPNIKYNEFVTLINELEEALTPKTTTEKPVEKTVEAKVETVEETVETPKAKTTTSKK
jgi:hypothetical protein